MKPFFFRPTIMSKSMTNLPPEKSIDRSSSPNSITRVKEFPQSSLRTTTEVLINNFSENNRAQSPQSPRSKQKFSSESELPLNPLKAAAESMLNPYTNISNNNVSIEFFYCTFNILIKKFILG